MVSNLAFGAQILVINRENIATNTRMNYLFDMINPLEVGLVTWSDETEIRWAVSRDVLIDCALHGRTAGEGDFVAQVNTDYDVAKYLSRGESLMFHMNGQGDDGDIEHAHVFVLRAPLRNFLQQTLLLVKQGDEGQAYDIDGFLEELLT